LDPVAAAYIAMRAGPPTPSVGCRVGFLTESASEQFLAEYHRLLAAGAIVPCAMVPSPVAGQMLLTEAVEAVESTEVEAVFEDALCMHTAQFLHEHGDEVSDQEFRLIASMPTVFVELAREQGVSPGELIELLLDPPDGMQEEAASVLGEIVGDLEAHFSEGAEDDDDDGPDMALDSQDKSLKKSVIDVLRSGYVPGSEGDRMFAALHRVERWEDPSGNGDDVFKGSNVRHATPLIDRSIARPAVMAESHTPWGIKPLSGLRMRSAIQ
jgi:hypothetical protein